MKSGRTSATWCQLNPPRVNVFTSTYKIEEKCDFDEEVVDLPLSPSGLVLLLHVSLCVVQERDCRLELLDQLVLTLVELSRREGEEKCLILGYQSTEKTSNPVLSDFNIQQGTNCCEQGLRSLNPHRQLKIRAVGSSTLGLALSRKRPFPSKLKTSGEPC